MQKCASQPSPHEILGVPINASLAEVRAAYRRAALATHPDKGGNKEEFQTVVLAFEALQLAQHDPYAGHHLGQATKFFSTSRAAGDQADKAPAGHTGATTSSAGTCTKKRRLRRFTSVDEILEELHCSLQALPQVQRQTVIAGMLSETHRLALERWMKAGKTSSQSVSLVQATRTPGGELETSSSSDAESDDEVCLSALCVADVNHMKESSEDAPSAGLLLFQSGGSSEGGRSEKSRPKTGFRARGICKQHSGWYAQVVVQGRLILRGKKQLELADAVSDHIAMLSFKRHFLELRQHRKTNVDDCVTKALSVMGNEAGFDPSSWRCRVMIASRFWLGTHLETPTTRVNEAAIYWARFSELAPWSENRVSGRHNFLHRAGLDPETASKLWESLRDEYIQIVLNNSSLSREIVSARIRRLEEKHACKREEAENRWRRRRKSADRTHILCLLRQFDGALQERERAHRLASQEEAKKQAAIAAKARRERAEYLRASSRRLREEKDFTMEDILHLDRNGRCGHGQ